MKAISTGWKLLAVLATLAGCTITTESQDQTRRTPETSMIEGIAAKGAPLANAQLEVRGKNAVTTTTTNTDGSYAIDVSTIDGPYLVRVCDGSFADSACGGIWYYSFADTAETGWANVHPLTDLILHAWYSVNSSVTVDAAFNDFTQALPTANDMETIGAGVKDIIRSIYPNADLLDDLLTASFAADGTGFDATLDALGPDFIPTIRATVEFVTANPGVFTRFLLRAGYRSGTSNGAPDNGPILHAEIFAPQGTIESATLSCESESGNLTVDLGKTEAQNSAIRGSDGFYVPGDRIDSPIAGSCDLTITKTGASSPVTFRSIPVLSYSGKLQFTSVSPLPLQAGVPITVEWTLPAGLEAQYIALVGWVNDSNGGFNQPDIIHPLPTATSATITLPAPTNGGTVSNLGISLFVNGTNAEYSEAQVSYSLP